MGLTLLTTGQFLAQTINSRPGIASCYRRNKAMHSQKGMPMCKQVGLFCRAGLLALLAVVLAAPVGAPAASGQQPEAPQGSPPAFGSANTGQATDNGDDGVTIGLPAGTTSGDLLLAFIVSDGIETIGAPDGWAEVNQAYSGQSSNNVTVALFRKFASGSEPANYSFTWTSQQGVGAILRYTGVDPSSPIDVCRAPRTATATVVPHRPSHPPLRTPWWCGCAALRAATQA
ncbi:MAG: hypothetical protein R2844_04610 [Caldilineales bacterium]